MSPSEQEAGRTVGETQQAITCLSLFLVQTFFSMLEGSATADKALVKRGLQFRENLTKKYKWDFSSEPDEFAPTVVETS